MAIALIVFFIVGHDLGGMNMKKQIQKDGGFCYIEQKHDYKLKHCYNTQKDGEPEKIFSNKFRK